MRKHAKPQHALLLTDPAEKIYIAASRLGRRVGKGKLGIKWGVLVIQWYVLMDLFVHGRRGGRRGGMGRVWTP